MLALRYLCASVDRCSDVPHCLGAVLLRAGIQSLKKQPPEGPQPIINREKINQTTTSLSPLVQVNSRLVLCSLSMGLNPVDQS